MSYFKLMFAFFVLWSVQVALSMKQQNHIRQTINNTKNKFNDGYLGFGIYNSKPKFFGKAFVILVLDEDDTVKEVQTLSGFSVLNRFKRHDKLKNYPVDEVGSALKSKKLQKAITSALDQIVVTKQENSVSTL